VTNATTQSMSERSDGSCAIAPAIGATALQPYAPPPPDPRIDLRLDANEGPRPAAATYELRRSFDAEQLRRYPSPRDLEGTIAARWQVHPEQVLVTAGADDAIDRCCRVMLDTDRDLILPAPTFEMIRRYAQLRAAHIIEPEWPDGAWPLAEVAEALTPRTALIAIVSPNNPTGCVVGRNDLAVVAQAAPSALLMIDGAYMEFADEDVTATALSLPNAVVIRTFSKAWGLAGLRVGYVIGPVQVIQWLRASGNPFAVAAPSMAIVQRLLEDDSVSIDEHVQRVRLERSDLTALLSGYRVACTDSQANFVLLRSPCAQSIWNGLARRGIAVRRFTGDFRLRDALRVTCPGDADNFDRLCAALRETLEELPS